MGGARLCVDASPLLANWTSSGSVRLQASEPGCRTAPFEVLVSHEAGRSWEPALSCPVGRLLPLEIALSCPGGCRLMLRSLNASALASKSLTSDSEGALPELHTSEPSERLLTPAPRSAVPRAPTARLAFFVRPPLPPPVWDSGREFVAQLTATLNGPEFSLRPGRLVLEEVSTTGGFVQMDVRPEESLFGGLRGGVSGPPNANVLHKLATRAAGLVLGPASRTFDPWPYGIVLLEEPNGRGYGATLASGLDMPEPAHHAGIRLWPRLDAADLAGVQATARNHTRNPNLAADAATYTG